MKIYLNKTVYEAAIERIAFFYDEFPNVVIGISGGKDSTVLFNLAYLVAKQKKRLPLNVFWIDQEAEWQGTVDMCQWIMTHQDVKPYWYQMPMVITNNASSYERYEYCWDEKQKDKWIHPKHELSIKTNNYNEIRFHKLFKAIMAVEFKGEKACYLAGVRTEECPKRFISLTEKCCYKYITYGSKLTSREEHYTFYPIYDWTFYDIWKAIHQNGWKYNHVYDELYQMGVSFRDMRISNIHHETSIQSLMLIQEIEPDTWDRVVNRMGNVQAIKHLKKCSFVCPSEYPNAFESWVDYAEYLIENIIQESQYKIDLRKRLNKGLSLYTDTEIQKRFVQTVINTILSSDWDWTKLTNFHLRDYAYTYRRWKAGNVDPIMLQHSACLPSYAIRDLKRKLNQ